MKTLMPYRGPSYSALRYAAMRKQRAFTVDEVMHTIGHRFEKPYIAGRSLDRLTKQGLLTCSDGKWTITIAGLEYLRTTVKPYQGENK